MEIKWTSRALESLFESTQYIRSENPMKAREVITGIQNAIEDLKMFPNLGVATPFKNTRDLIHSKYDFLIRYRLVDESLIEIIFVWHASQGYR
ncbi:MAG: type II toxin-antitoxin system RelE/ParE family toxin [Magnetococcales bacterium]|nr:type II toxin-antitoxin system RelE/ParE family toxin [Magnetococcales bacterium]